MSYFTKHELAAANRELLWQGLQDGTIDCIATDHAPHHYDEKEQAFDEAPPGMLGAELEAGSVWDAVLQAEPAPLAVYVFPQAERSW